MRETRRDMGGVSEMCFEGTFQFTYREALDPKPTSEDVDRMRWRALRALLTAENLANTSPGRLHLNLEVEPAEQPERSGP